MKNLLIPSLAILLLTFVVSCKENPEEAADLEPQNLFVAAEQPWVTIEMLETTENTIEVIATVESVGHFIEQENVEYGFIWFESYTEPVNDEFIFEPAPQESVVIGTLSEKSPFTFTTTIENLEEGTMYNVCTFLEGDSDMMIGEEIIVETLQ